MKLKNDLLLRVAKGERTERPPVWLMRQAGRILPQYRALRAEVAGFKALVSNPDLAAEVTIQPVDELGVDAAIIFSDILVIPEAMGLDYEMVEKRGPLFPETIKDAKDVAQLNHGANAAEHLEYVYEAIKRTKTGLNNRIPLIGFAGAPWTIFAYMVEGSGSKTFSKAKKLLYQEPVLAHQLLQKITDTTIAYLKEKIKAGVDIVQIFDSWASLLSPAQYQEFAAPYIKAICDSIDEVPKIIFARGAHHSLAAFSTYPAQVIGLDWNIRPVDARKILGENQVVQGNLDPCALYGSAADIQANTTGLLNQFGRHHIANLGHGVYPDTPLDNVKVFVDTVKSFRYED